MKPSALAAALLASAAFSPLAVHAQSQTIQFAMVQTAGTNCPGFTPSATVTDHTFGEFENLEVVVKGLPPNTGFDLFSIQVPHAKFGLAWYIGDIVTDSTGTGVGNFVGRFNRETFIVSLAALPSPNIFHSPPAVLPQSTTGAQVNPVQIYHLGLWFNSPSDAGKFCGNSTPTPFNGEHNAGIQILNTSKFADNAGPLLGLQ
ncbi:MAG: hypothetical protein J2P49_04780 [Methylocapsa sp.]|nr:hypothetical protein [Methylocapsa sp.]